MISQTDDPDLPMEFTVMNTDMPQFINFMHNGEEVGRLTLSDPMTFEGNADEAAQVFFNHVTKIHSTTVKKLQARIDELEREKRDMIDELNERHRGGR